MSSESKKGLYKQVGFLAIAGVVSRIIGLLYRSPLTAIIGDDGNGYYTAAYYFYNIALLISAYSIPSAMSKIISGKLAVREYRNAHRIFKCALVYVSVVGGLASLLLFFGANFFAVGRAATVLKFFAPTVFFFGFLGVLRGYSQAHRNMIPTSVSQILEQLLNAVVSVGGAYMLTNYVGDEDLPKRAMFGAIGSALGTGSGVIIALLFMLFVYSVNKTGIHRRVDKDFHDDMGNHEAFKLIFIVVTPFILSTAIYNLSTTVNSALFSRILINVKNLEEHDVTTVFGVYSGRAMVLSNLPIALSSAAAMAMIPEVSTAFARGNKEEAGDTVSRVMRIILMISIPAAVGLFALARPVMMVLFPSPNETIPRASLLLMLLAITVVFYSVSTLTNAVLQGIGKLKEPVINAAIALVIQTAVLWILLVYTNINDIALCIVTIIYSLTMCILNNFVMKKHIPITYDFRKTYLLPSISALVMGIVAFCTHMIFEKLFIKLSLWITMKLYGEEIAKYYLSNLIATVIAVGIALFVYFAVLIKSGGASEDDIKRFPKGVKIAQILKKLRIL
ncbi:polysaccharide biosynthesis protein [Butyrivibrio sp. X503]|uniref:putative polysaccharide biosynthesis protein n=1 Tax=Butyrivibrio sp. X503 TaxID=2364878 RepID=UPI000EA98330|nr:polysaccharide biosynthesis protein [Butyrivibrio sp. X503]RKM57400.1 polysaccharide biosynthesis protein [Butyrivibrio sp. X503]